MHHTTQGTEISLFSLSSRYVSISLRPSHTLLCCCDSHLIYKLSLSLSPLLTFSLWFQWKPAPPQTCRVTRKTNQIVRRAHNTPLMSANHRAGISMSSQEVESASPSRSQYVMSETQSSEKQGKGRMKM